MLGAQPMQFDLFRLNMMSYSVDEAGTCESGFCVKGICRVVVLSHFGFSVHSGATSET